MKKEPREEMQQSLKGLQKSLQEYTKGVSKKGELHAQRQMEEYLASLGEIAAAMPKEVRLLEARLAKNFQVFIQYPSENNHAVIAQDVEAIQESLRH